MKSDSSVEPNDGIDLDAWMAEIDRLSVLTGDPGLTRKELQAVLGCGDRQIYRLLHSMRDADTLGVGKAYRKNLVNVVHLTEVYRPVAPEKAARRKVGATKP